MNETPGEPKRVLSLLDSTMINVGCMIGSGIFLVSQSIGQLLPYEPLILAAWIVGGLVSMMGAVAIAELGAMMPHSGGQFVYLREAYGPLWGFLYGWAVFGVIITASIAAIAVGFATYAGYVVQLSPLMVQVVAILSIVLLTVVNCYGVRWGARIQNVLTFIKIGSLVVLAVWGLWLGFYSTPDWHLPERAWTALIGPFSLVLVAVLWSYDGWIEITFIAGEVKDPHRNIPASLVSSMLLIIFLYGLVNVSYHLSLSISEIQSSPFVASDVATKFLGMIGATLMAAAVSISMFGANNGFVFTGARIYQAMAREKLFFKKMAQLHPTYQTPVIALIGQGVWACILVLSGTFEQLITYVIFVSWLFYAMSAGAVFILRKKQPDRDRPYRAWGHPWTTTVFIAFSLFLVVNSVIQAPRESLIGLLIILSGLPAYAYWKRQKAV